MVNIDCLIYNQIGLAKDISLHEMLKLYHEYKRQPIRRKQKFRTKEEYDNYLEEYKRSAMSKLIPFSLFIERYFHKHDLWKLPPILDLVAPALFKQELNQVGLDVETSAIVPADRINLNCIS